MGSDQDWTCAYSQTDDKFSKNLQRLQSKLRKIKKENIITPIIPKIQNPRKSKHLNPARRLPIQPSTKIPKIQTAGKVIPQRTAKPSQR